MEVLSYLKKIMVCFVLSHLAILPLVGGFEIIYLLYIFLVKSLSEIHQEDFLCLCFLPYMADAGEKVGTYCTCKYGAPLCRKP